MAESLKAVILSFGPTEFEMIHSACVDSDYTPVAYIYGRTLRPNDQLPEKAGRVIDSILRSSPPRMDLILPGSAENLSRALPAYQADLLVCFGFGWKLPDSVLRIPRLGAINVHGSLLPQYRGPAPLLWALRNGDPTMGVTIHWMDHGFDTGNIIVQQGGITLADDIDRKELFGRFYSVVSNLLRIALRRAAENYMGEAQDDSKASYAGYMEDGFTAIDWSRNCRDIHNQVRMYRFLGSETAPLAWTDGHLVRVVRTSLTSGHGRVIQCGDGPIWLTEFEVLK